MEVQLSDIKQKWFGACNPLLSRVRTVIGRQKTGVARAVGVEFGAEGVAVVCARPSADDGVFSYCAFHAESRVAEQAVLLKHLVGKNNWQGAACHLVLHPAQYQMSITEAPDLPETDLNPQKLRDAMRERMHDLFNISPDDLAYDVVLLPEDSYRGRGRMVLVVAMDKQDMLKRVTEINQSGLVLESINTTETALGNLSLSVPSLSKPTALLRVRSTAALLTVSETGRPVFHRVLDIGLDALRRQQNDETSLQAMLDTLVLEVQRSLDFYESQRREAVRQLYLLPTKQEIPMLSRALTAGLAIAVSKFPFESLLSQEMLLGNGLSASEQAYFMSAAGASLRGMAW